MVESKPTNQHKQKYLNTGEVAERLGSSKGTVRDLCRRGLLSGANKERKGGPWRIPEKAVEEWIKNNKPAISTDDFSVNKQVIESKGSFQVSETPGPPIWWQRFRYSPWIFYPTVVFGILIAVIGVLSGLISLGADFGGFKNQVHQWGIVRQFPPAADNETLIVIATFHRTEGVTDTDAHNEIRRAIEVAASDLGLSDLRVEIEQTRLRSDEEVDAEVLGKRYNASMVIWGADTGVRVTVRYLNLKAPYLDAANIRIVEVDRTQLANPSSYARFVTEDLPHQLVFLSLFAIGQMQMLDGNYSEAINTIETGVDSLPTESQLDGLAEAYFHLGWLYQTSLIDAKQAISNYDKAIKLNPDDFYAYNNRGLIQLDHGDFSAAITDFSRAISLNDKLAAIYHNRGNARYQLADLAGAFADYNQAIDLMSNSAQTYLGRGNVYYDWGNLDAAITDYDMAISINPAFVEALVSRGNVHRDKKDLNGAITDYEQAIALSPDFDEAYVALGLAHYDLQNLSRAIENFDKAISLNPEAISAYVSRGLAYHDLNKSENAMSDYNQAIALNPDDAIAYYNRARLRYDLFDLKGALSDINQAIKLKPTYIESYIIRGNCYASQGYLEKAFADYDQAIALDPDNAKAYYNRGNLYQDQNNLVQAIDDLNQAIALDPDFSLAYNNRGIIRVAQSDLQGAIDDFNRVINLDPEFALAYSNRGLAYAIQGDIEAAVIDYDQAILLKPDYDDAYFNRGLARIDLGDKEGATADFLQVLALSANSSLRNRTQKLLETLETK